MQDALELIQTRRSVKQFEPRLLSWEKIARVVDAGRYAPSCGNLQNWKFIVVNDPGKKELLAQASFDQYEIVAAGALIVICSEPQMAERYYGARGSRLYSIQNCAAAAQNMLLEAHSLGLGSLWVGGFDEDAVRDALGIPAEIRPQVIVAIGYAKAQPPKPPKYPLETVVYLNGWRSKIRDIAKYTNDLATIMARNIGGVSKGITNTVKKLLPKK